MNKASKRATSSGGVGEHVTYMRERDSLGYLAQAHNIYTIGGFGGIFYRMGDLERVILQLDTPGTEGRL